MQTTEVAGPASTTSLAAQMRWVYPSLALPSLFIVQKFLGSAGAVAYASGIALLVAASARTPAPRTRRAELVLALALVATLVIVFAAFYQRVNVHLPMQGSDDDDAYNLGARALLHGRSPYLERTYLGNVLHQFAGAFLLAMPFVLLGTSALQNLFWIPAFFVVARSETRDGRAVHLAALTLLASPVVLHQVATGTGHIANTIYVAIGLWCLCRADRHQVIASIAWGVTLASRANFLFLVPFAFEWIRRRKGLSEAIRSSALTLTTVAALTLPFYLASPGNFGPLEAADRLTRFDERLPYASAVVTAGMGMAALWLASRVTTLADLFKYCAVVQAIPVLAGTALGFVQWHVVDLAYLSYLNFAAWFALMGWLLADRQGVPEPATAEVRPDGR